MRAILERCAISAGQVQGEESELPHDAVEGCNAQKVPLRGDPAPKLIQRQRVAF